MLNVVANSKADKYINVVQKSLSLRGKKNYKVFINNWNNNNPNNQTSYSSIIRMRRRYLENGICGLLSVMETIREERL